MLAGCSTLRLGYANGPQLAWWWLDGYFDFESRQTAAVRAAIERWFAWHRRVELPVYAGLLAEAAAAAPRPTTADEVCRWTARVRDAAAPALDQALREAAPLVGQLREPQLAHLAHRFDKRLAELRDEFAQPDPTLRREKAAERAIERFERLYGRLDAPQRRLVAVGLAESPFDAEAWIADRDRRQREALQTLRRLAAQRADADAALPALRALAGRADALADPAYRATRDAAETFNCALAARLHNATTPAQRAKAAERLRDWQSDLLTLAASAAGEPVPALP